MRLARRIKRSFSRIAWELTIGILVLLLLPPVQRAVLWVASGATQTRVQEWLIQNVPVSRSVLVSLFGILFLLVIHLVYLYAFRFRSQMRKYLDQPTHYDALEYLESLGHPNEAEEKEQI